MSSLQGKGMSSSDNQPTTSTRGGASAHPTPANNSGGGAGWGDSGLLKGGLEGVSNRLSSTSGESHSGKISSLNGELSSLKEQKMAGEQRYRQDIEESGGTVPKSSDHSDASFMTGKPGGAGTLPGWETAKGALNSMMGNE
ncbi:hypothetical protein AN7990.2 [Aspergillus nidulans FGSC A4]|uniref:Uncharacterized protein n=1 Tax=Emericella nidulans (strain FGSC A4 / ATCC 38163 / CBS 112.46 / NRRL 194 / M139) TaxID=227321 RepID=Q5AUP0_EMENI|nr:hypothetical protein [Aspergillus nidulans FGSC A4]EAA58793.1 hypothetical protein AN7990.2 [Aspergillus nidulans FGSC A4]CBF73662.1 TPA: conserved hypothetical protein [Aspergillus nidulans FGSC A4]|eukprot:XP_681259.1 hypothetical protein AN7990.2 [Aspergillus nidulans FGSC A4]